MFFVKPKTFLSDLTKNNVKVLLGTTAMQQIFYSFDLEITTLNSHSHSDINTTR